MRRILLVRHCAIANHYQGICYGRSNVELSPSGYAESHELAARLALEPVTRVYHSGLLRTRIVAEALGALVGLPAEERAALAERDFGAWELRAWDDIYTETGDAMLGSIREPATWCPPGGETTFGLRDRVRAWYDALPPAGVIVAVTHGGPIAALVGSLREQPVETWPALVPAPGGVIEV